jgi:hypothetical protein
MLRAVTNPRIQISANIDAMAYGMLYSALGGSNFRRREWLYVEINVQTKSHVLKIMRFIALLCYAKTVALTADIITSGINFSMRIARKDERVINPLYEPTAVSIHPKI